MKICPKCGKNYFYFPETCPTLHAYMGVNGERTYIYCSEKCMNDTFSKLNTHGELPIIVLSKDRISKNPLVWQVVCEVNLKVELLPELR